MIDNVFGQMHELIDKARTTLKHQFKEHLVEVL